MKENRKKKIRSEKGSITLYVLVVMLFFITILILNYSNQVNKISSQKKQITEIEKEYNVNKMMEEKYYEIEGKLPVSIVLYKPSGEIYNIDEWTNEDLKLEIFYPGGVTDEAKYYYLDGVKKLYTKNEKITGNGTIKVEQNGEIAEVKVSKIDKELPIIGSTTQVATSETTFDMTITASDQEGSGLSKCYISEGEEEKEVTIDGTITIADIKANTTYQIYVTDVAGNQSAVKTITTPKLNYGIDDTMWTTTLAQAVSKASKGSTIKLLNNYTDSSSVTINENITLNTNAKKLTRTATITIAKGSAVIFQGGGTITMAQSNKSLIVNNGTLTINNGTYQITQSGQVLKNNGTVTMSGGTVISKNAGWTFWNLGTFNFKGGTINHDYADDGTALMVSENGSAVVKMSGGTIISKAFGLVVHEGKATTTGGTIQTVGAAYDAVLVRNLGKATLKNTKVAGSATGRRAVSNETTKYENLILYSRASNYGVTGTIAGFVVATTNTGAGQASEKVTIYNTGCQYLLFPTWTSKNGQDDIDWMRSTSSSGTHTVTILKSKHNNETGTYVVHIYSADSSFTAKTALFGINLTF